MNKYIYLSMFLLSSCASFIPKPGYVIIRDTNKDNGEYTCVYKNDTIREAKLDGAIYPDYRFNNEKSVSKSACKKDLSKTVGYYRCYDYVSRDVLGVNKYDGTEWGARMYNKCVANGNSNCWANSYQFTECIAAKCNYKAKKINFGKNNIGDDWITKEDWEDCASR